MKSAPHVAGISLDRESGEILVVSFSVAVDADLIMTPDNARAQIEGGSIVGVGNVRPDGVGIENGQTVLESRYHRNIML